MIYGPQAYMKTLTVAEAEEARTEVALAHPQWEREGTPEALSGHNQRCDPCGVMWRSTQDFAVCWMCGEAPTHTPRTYASTLSAPRNQREWEYAGQPTTPASGCGCDDPTVLMVAKLLADGVDLHTACLLTYGDAS